MDSFPACEATTKQLPLIPLSISSCFDRPTMDLHAAGAQPQAGPSILTPASSPYQESSQFLHWRYTSSNLHALRDALNAKSVEVVGRNSALEKVSLFSRSVIYQ